MRYLTEEEMRGPLGEAARIITGIAFLGDSYPVSAHRGDIGQGETWHAKYLEAHVRTKVKRVPFGALYKE
jgi:hypothetical protein